MIGAGDLGTCIRENGEFDELAGITPRAVSELFRLLSERQAQVSTEVEVQMFQLYRDGLDDLLVGSGGKKKRNDFEGGDRVDLKITLAEHSATGLVNVEGACSMVAENAGDVMRIFAKGAERRTTASTQMNAESSRYSHTLSQTVESTQQLNTPSQHNILMHPTILSQYTPQCPSSIIPNNTPLQYTADLI